MTTNILLPLICSIGVGYLMINGRKPLPVFIPLISALLLWALFLTSREAGPPDIVKFLFPKLRHFYLPLAPVAVATLVFAWCICGKEIKKVVQVHPNFQVCLLWIFTGLGFGLGLALVAALHSNPRELRLAITERLFLVCPWTLPIGELLFVWVLFGLSQRKDDKPSLSGTLRLGIFYWGVLLPLYFMFLATFCFQPEYQTQKGTLWLPYSNDGIAGIATWPLFLVASGILELAILRPDWKSRTTTNCFASALTLAIISVWYACWSLLPKATGGLPFVVLVPGLASLNYFLLAYLFWPGTESFRSHRLSIGAWVSALIATTAMKYPLVEHMLAQLPEEPPPGYGDCFIVTAAAHGHPSLVRSWMDPTRGKPVNQQVLTFWAFESLLMGHCPRFHRILRRIYNRVGPLVVRGMRLRVQADMMYVLLKPLEWSAARICRVRPAKGERL